MITSVTINKDTSEYSCQHSHIFSCPKLVGRTFNFQVGLNVICGYNGCGKSTLLDTIRTMTFCDKEMYSKLEPNGHNIVKLSNTINDGIYDFIDLRNDWNKSVFSLRPSSEITAANFDNSTSNMLQSISGKRLSSGMDMFISIHTLLDAIKENKYFDDDNIDDFNKMVVNARPSNTSLTPFKDFDVKCVQKVLKYQKEHQVDNPILTIIMDEPDRSVDVNVLEMLAELFSKQLKRSYICVFHSTSLIYRLLKTKGCNITWHELTPGYLDNIINFTEGRPIVRPQELDWIVPGSLQ